MKTTTRSGNLKWNFNLRIRINLQKGSNKILRPNFIFV